MYVKPCLVYIEHDFFKKVLNSTCKIVWGGILTKYIIILRHKMVCDEIVVMEIACAG